MGGAGWCRGPMGSVGVGEVRKAGVSAGRMIGGRGPRSVPQGGASTGECMGVTLRCGTRKTRGLGMGNRNRDRSASSQCEYQIAMMRPVGRRSACRSAWLRWFDAHRHPHTQSCSPLQYQLPASFIDNSLPPSNHPNRRPRLTGPTDSSRCACRGRPVRRLAARRLFTPTHSLRLVRRNMNDSPASGHAAPDPTARCGPAVDCRKTASARRQGRGPILTPVPCVTVASCTFRQRSADCRTEAPASRLRVTPAFANMP